jgi:hypothetical protein
MATLGYALAASSRTSEALALIEELKAQPEKQYVSPMGIARIYIGLRRPDAAMDWLEKAYEERVDRLVWLKRDPAYDPLRANHRFQALVRRLALP